MYKATVRYGHPENPEAFDRYYVKSHSPIAQTNPGLIKLEKSHFLPGPDGSKPDYRLMAKLNFAGTCALQHTCGSQEGQAATADPVNFSTRGLTVLSGAVS